MSAWAGIDEFCAVAHARSFAQAARRLDCSTSQISREIARLEDRLGQRLFYRTTRHVSLTDAGERFFERCRRLQEERDEAIEAMADDALRLQGQLRMTCSVTYGERFVAPLVNQFMAQHPWLSVDMVLTNEIVDLVDGGLDLAIRFGGLEDSRLVATRLSHRAWRLCAAPAYLAQAGAPKTLEDLANHQCLKGQAETWSFQIGGAPVQHKVQGRFRCNSGEAVLQAALAGLGLCQLPDFYVRDSLASGRLVELLEAYRSEDEGVWAIYPHRRHLPRKVKLMVDHLQAHLGAG